jgi:hypothetical protein
VGDKCRDHISKGFLILNTEEKCEGGSECAGDYEGVSNAIQRAINALHSSPGKIPRGLFIGVVRGSGNNV